MSRFHRAGWILFVISAVLFVVAGLRARDAWTVGGAVVFGSACLLFLFDPGDH